MLLLYPLRVKNDVLAGIMERLQKMRDKPKMFYSAEEGSLYSKAVFEYLEGEKIELHRTRGHGPAFAERFIRTYKDMLSKRAEADGFVSD